jgi:hypothetical protein
MTSLIVGTAGLNLVFVAVGYALLAPVIRGSSVRGWLSYAGVALLVGVAVTGVALCGAAIAGARIGPAAFAIVAAPLMAVGLAAYGRLPARTRTRLAHAEPPAHARAGRRLDGVATVGCALLASMLCIAVIGAFRSTPWLSDVWTFWLPKGIALDKNGLDPGLWLGHGGVVEFPVPDYPLLWSIVLNLDIRFVGRVDLRAVNVQEAYLLLGFAGTIARLLWGIVRPWILWAGILFSLALPELLRHAQGGAADVPLSFYVTAALVAATAWLLRRWPLALALVGVFSAAAFSIKSESYPDTAIWLVLLTAVAWPLARRPIAAVWGAVAVGALSSAPWLAWKAEHHVANQIHLGDLFGFGYLRHHTATLHGALHTITGHFTSVREWTFVFPAFVLVGIVGAVLERRPRRRLLWLGAPAFVLVSWAMLVWLFWADREGSFRLVYSAYRLVDVFALISALGATVGVELIIRGRRSG